MLGQNKFWQVPVNMFLCVSETIHLQKRKINIAFNDVQKLSKYTKKEVEFQSICKHGKKEYVSN